MTRLSPIALSLLAVAVLAGCNKHSEQAQGPQAAAVSPAVTVPENTGQLERRAASNRTYSLIDLSWSSLPEHEYQKVYVQVRNAYWSGAPKNLEKLAEDFSQAYRREKNSFKRADLLKTLTPELEKSYSGAQGQKDFAFRTPQLLSIGPYDSQKGGFKVSLPNDAEQVESTLAKDSDLSKNNHHWRFRFVGVPHEELFYKPKDEAEAREIEAVLAPHRGNGQEPVFTFIQFAGSEIGTLTKDAGLSDVALIGVDAITAIDRDSGKQLFTLAGQDLGPMEVQCRSTREALKLPEPKSTTPTGLGAMNTVSGPSC